MPKPSQNKAIKEFKAVTGASSSTATTCLQRYNYSVEQALDYFFSHQHLFPSSKAKPVKRGDEAKITTIFTRYDGVGEDEGIICEEKLNLFLTDVKVTPNSLEACAVSWKLKCQSIGEISKKEFVDGWAALGCDTIAAMQTFTDKLGQDLASNHSMYKEFYKWSFEFAKDDDAKQLPPDFAFEMWQVVLPGHFPLMTEWLDFAKNKKPPIKAVTKDLWYLLYDFGRDVKPDLSNYDPDNGAWPVVIDEFCEYLIEQRKK